MKKAKPSRLAPDGAHAPGCHSINKIRLFQLLSREKILGMPGARLELARPIGAME